MKRKPRADGRYQAKILTGTVDGKQQYKYVYAKTKKELEDKLAVLRVEVGRGADLTQPMSLSFWIDRWLARTDRTQTETWHSLCEARAQIWKDALGKMDISRITTADLEDVLLDLAKENPATGRPSGKKTLKEYASIIRRVFALAVQNRVINYDPSQYLPSYKNAPQGRREAITDEQITAIRNTPHECRLPCLLMIYTGLRFGELAALTWSDVDLAENTITVNKSYDFKSQSIKTPKTEAGVRIIPIPDLLVPELQNAPHDALFVCSHNSGMWTHNAWKNSFAGYLKQLGFTTTAHCLRHTYATILYEAGVDVLTAQHWLGHADSATTMGIYTHLREQKQSAAILQLNAHLTPEKASNGVTTVSK